MFHEKWPWRRDREGRTIHDILPRWLRWSLGGLIAAVAAGCLMIWSVSHDPERWHVDPLSTERTGRANDYLVSPENMAAAPADRVFAPREMAPAALIGRWHEIAMAAPRTEVVAGTPEQRFVTYVQRSAVFGFPDYISVRVVETEGGAALAIWSRARYGYSDLGVNRARVEDWLARL